jgi:hypothetical protein
MGVQNSLTSAKLLKRIRGGFEQVKDHRASNTVISLADALLSALAMFLLKDSALLEFEARREKDENLKRIYNIERVPSDSQMRTIMDEVSPAALSAQFKDTIGQLRQSKVLTEMAYLGGHYLLTLDGTGYFWSKRAITPFCSIM